ncbi:MAG: hypothetical protein ACI9SJ_000322 [Flavobacteriaceae bacterium]|jgi:hypothetical protein|uniref:DUF6913 domain-containing protein n=1 Tax=Candidatus Marifrigoribacter sp. Uisw_064 TaxID=3230970 RepID=UPI003ADA738A
MFEKLKRKYLKRQIDENLKGRDLTLRNSSLKRLGFLVDENILLDIETLYDFSKELQIHRKDVKIYSFREVKKKLPTLVQNQINNKDFTWRGDIDNQNATEFLDIPFDVLIGFYSGKNEFLDVMVSKSKAKFKVGFKGGDERLYDLLMDIDPNNIEGFKLELIKYLTILNKIN